MIEEKDMAAKSKELRQLLEAKLGARGKTLQQALRRAGRRLPRSLRKGGAVLAKAETMAAHPKLARQLNPREVDFAYKALATHLKAIDVADARKGRWMATGAVIAFNMLVIVLGFVVWLWWRGYV